LISNFDRTTPAGKARKVIAATRVTHDHRISWVELPELLEAIERFEQQRLAERSSLIALRLMMLTLVRSREDAVQFHGEAPAELRQEHQERLQAALAVYQPAQTGALQCYDNENGGHGARSGAAAAGLG
jgi:hypothetical protein